MPASTSDIALDTLDASKKEDDFLEDKGEKREIGGDAVWTLSTAKPGNGVEQLRYLKCACRSSKQTRGDNNTETYWQSDGPQPHLVNIQFHKKVSVQEICIYCDFKHDESYTPSKISIRAGTHFHDLQEVKEVTLEEPSGWLSVQLSRRDLSHNEASADDDAQPPPSLRAFMLQIAVLANHENGRDSHIRQVKVFGPRQECCGLGLKEGGGTFESLDFSMFSTIR